MKTKQIRQTNTRVFVAFVLLMTIISASVFTACSDDDDNSGTASISDDGNVVTGKINGHYYVDLGLSVKWADRNIGALSSTAYGDYYSWGDTTTLSKTYCKDTCDIAGNVEYDAATAKWGSEWRMPTKAECVELLNNCSWEWTSRDSINGYLVTGANNNSIFLPAAGYINDDLKGSHGVGEEGYYYCSTSYKESYVAYFLAFDSTHHLMYDDYKLYHMTIRPVSEW